MYGVSSPCMLLVFSNPRPGADEALARWYMEVHGPDALGNGTFSALHRYEAVGDYDARFLALWEGSFTSLDEARSQMVPKAGGLRDRGRITPDLMVVWSSLEFLTAAAPSGERAPVSTLTLVKGDRPEMSGPGPHRYGGVSFYESPDRAEDVMARWSGHGEAGIAPHGPYRNIFDHPEGWPFSDPKADVGSWVSHWRPIGSLRRSDLAGHLAR
jgi:hypothetical protein